MDLLDRYVSAIASQLPDAQKADVTAELRDLLMSQVEERESELGRPLNPSEMEALLKAFGHPLIVAGRYRKFNQLIGPEVFPFYWFGLRALLIIITVVQVITTGILMAASSDPGEVFGESVERLFGVLIAAVGWITVAFVVVEQTGAVKHLQRWSPRQLPPAVLKQRKSRIETAIEIALLLLFVAWWTGWNEWPEVMSSHGPVLLSAGPMREVLHVPVLVVAVASIVATAIELVRPGWVRLNAGLSLLCNLAVIGLLVAYVRGGPVVEVAGDASAGELWRVQQGVGLGITIGLGVLGVIAAWEAVKDAWWLLRGRAVSQEWSLGAAR